MAPTAAGKKRNRAGSFADDLEKIYSICRFPGVHTTPKAMEPKFPAFLEFFAERSAGNLQGRKKMQDLGILEKLEQLNRVITEREVIRAEDGKNFHSEENKEFMGGLIQILTDFMGMEGFELFYIKYDKQCLVEENQGLKLELQALRARLAQLESEESVAKVAKVEECKMEECKVEPLPPPTPVKVADPETDQIPLKDLADLLDPDGLFL